MINIMIEMMNIMAMMDQEEYEEEEHPQLL